MLNQRRPNASCVNCLNEMNHPSSLFKPTNLQDCAKKQLRRGVTGPAALTKSRGASKAAMILPACGGSAKNERWCLTVEKCDAGGMVMKCPNFTPHHVKVLPKDLV